MCIAIFTGVISGVTERRLIAYSMYGGLGGFDVKDFSTDTVCFPDED